ncbi:protein kinase-like domain [Fusarium austroafricanum]|uniref:Protein kinase-like domain n=1 Tax=Fusarium austroafricanum TaxID=2364996 RepID=A0A8H4PBV8_9HYPO|nr:protein kinase-like domain [Fusarium austroafricanum]
MLIDPSTLRITAILDFEFTNSMLAQFTYDPPWWLLLRGPDVWLDRNSMDEFLARYVPRMEQFLRALERVEETSAMSGHKELEMEPRLSTRMRDSWKTGRFWFNYAARTCLDMDDIYWHTLHDQVHGDGFDLLDEVTRAQLEPLVLMKMEQLKAYDKERAVRFGDD